MPMMKMMIYSSPVHLHPPKRYPRSLVVVPEGIHDLELLNCGGVGVEGHGWHLWVRWVRWVGLVGGVWTFLV